MSDKRIIDLEAKQTLGSGDYLAADSAQGTYKVDANTNIMTPLTNVRNNVANSSASPDKYSSSTAYKVGDMVIHDDILYICTTACSAASWAVNSACFTAKTLASVITQLNSELNKNYAYSERIDRPTAFSTFLLMGDSFGPTSGWPTAFVAQCESSATVYDQTEGARTFVSATTYLAKLQTFVGAHTADELADIDYLILLGGIGDSHPDTNSILGTRINEFITYAKANLPNAKIYLGYIGGGLTGYGGSADVGNATPIQRLRATAIYDEWSNRNKCFYISGINNVVNNYRWYKGTGEDGLHPLAATGIGDTIARYVFNFIDCGSATYVVADTGTVTVGSNSVQVEAFQYDNITELLIPKFSVTLGSAIGANGTKSYKLATMPAWSPIWGSDLLKIDTRVVTGSEAGFVPLYLYIYKHDLYITNFEKKTTSDWWDIPSGSLIEVPDCVFRMATPMVLKSGYSAHG